MESNSLPIKIRRFFSSVTNKIIENRSYFIVLTLIGVLIYLAYYYSYNRVVNDKMAKLDNEYESDIVFQTDYCSPSLIDRKLVDYHVKSSFSSGSTGLQNYDYLSLDMVKKIIYLGTRMLDFEIFANSLRNDSVPVISSGFSKGDWKLTQNTLKCEDVFTLIKEFAFSDRFITNNRDPMFIFLDLKTKNIEVLDKLADIILNYIPDKLLTKEDMSKFNNNIANATVCQLMNKLIIMASDDAKDSKLHNLINISVGPNLNRIRYSDAVIHKRYNENKPDSYFKSKRISFHSGLSYDYIQSQDPNTDFHKSGFKPGMLLEISGAKYSENNTGKNFLTIDDVTPNKISIQKRNVFKSELEGNLDILKGFNIIVDTQHIEEQNKNRLTIIIPDKGVSDRNFNPKNAWFTGSQFVCMRFQNTDEYMQTYLNFFSKRCIRLKQDSLLNKIEDPSEDSLLPLVKPKQSIIYDIDTDFMKNNLNLIVFLQPYFNSDFKLICNEEKKFNISLMFDDDDYKFEIVKSPSKDVDNAVMIKFGNQYLVSNEEDNYLRFETKPKDTDIKDYTDCLTDKDLYKQMEYKDQLDFCKKKHQHTLQFIKRASFLILRSTNQSINNSIGQIKQKIDKSGNEYEQLYYLRYNTKFNAKSKLYKKKQTKYKKIITLSYTPDNSTEQVTYTIWRPLTIDNFYPIGDVIFKGTNLPMDSNDESVFSYIVKGAINTPIGYEKVYDNSSEINASINSGESLYSIWKPKPPDGYLAMGVVVSEGVNQPTKDTVVCVRADLLKEAEFQSNLTNIDTSNYSQYKQTFYNKSISMWTGTSNNLNYFISYPTTITSFSRSKNIDILEKPNTFDYPLYDFVDQKGFIDDLIYLDDNINEGDKQSYVFKIVINSEDGEFTSYQTYDDINNVKDMDNKVRSYTNNRIGGDMCMSLPNPYWTSVFDLEEKKRTNTYDNLLYLNKTNNSNAPHNFPVKTNEHTCTKLGGFMPTDEVWKASTNDASCYFRLSEQKGKDTVFINKRDSCLGDSKLGSAGLKVSYKDCLNMNGTTDEIPNSENDIVKCNFDICSSSDEQTLLLSKNNISDSNLDKASMYFSDEINDDSNDTCAYVNGVKDGMECKKDIYYTKDKAIFPLKNEGCRDMTYIGTSWYHDDDESIHFKYNPKFCVSAQLDEKNNIYTNSLGPNVKGPDNKLVLERCKSGRVGQKFKYIDNNLKYVSPNSGTTNYCVTNNRDDSLRLEPCTSNPDQKWEFDQMPLDYMITEGSIIYYYHKIPRRQKENPKMVFNTPVPNLLEEKYDNEYFHMFVRCRVMSIDNSNINVKYFHNPDAGIVSLPIKSELPKIILDYPALQDKLDKNIGSKVLIRNGSIITPEMTIQEENVMWYGVVTKKIDERNYQVFVTINSIEPNKNNLRMNRADHPQVLSVNIENILLFKEALLRN